MSQGGSGLLSPFVVLALFEVAAQRQNRLTYPR
jgi:hypothetical protein